MKEQIRLESAVIDAINYFGIFHYAPTAKEIHRFSTVSAEIAQVRLLLDKLLSRRVINEVMVNGKVHYCIPGRGITQKKLEHKELFTSIKLSGVSRFIHMLAQTPWVRFVGLSGSLAMSNAKQKDDVDLFIITAQKRIWLGRLTSVLFSEIVGLRRRRNATNVDGRVCLNMFFDESSMTMPEDKRSLYVAHEVLQMHPLPPYTRETLAYRRFIQSNMWVYELFPNAHVKGVTAKMYPNLYQSRTTYIGNFLERVARAIQIFFIRRHQTVERVSDTQLWFFPEDFEQRVSSRYTKSTYGSAETKKTS